MKKLIILTIILLGLSSCDVVHVQYPLIVEKIEFNKDGGDVRIKYMVTLSTLRSDDFLYMYTDSLFQVGDTIR